MISSVLNKVSSPVRAQMPKMKSLVRTVQRAKKSKDEVVNPKTLKELVIPDIYKTVNDDELFLLHDSGGGADRFLIYATEKNLDLLAECTMWFCDGTFSSVPLIFKQLYTIHGSYDGKILPFVYILAPNKSQKLYLRVLKVIKHHKPNLNPQRAMVDFERAFINAFKHQFARCYIIGCHFHFCKCVWSHIQSTGLQNQYTTDLKFCINLKMFMALAFVPIDDVIEAYEELIKSSFYQENATILTDFVSYVERTWIGELSRLGNKRTKPLFDLLLWNCYQAVLDDIMRSNNCVEGWHNSFNRKVRVIHAIFSSFINFIKSEQVITETTITQMDAGINNVAKKRKIYADKDKRIMNVVLQYDPTKELKYLKNIASAMFV
ncbi:uncharacterized protein LOC106693699 [Microplitis demolitor]|uniref:uncharacterized protein LOC106693699 n=1 Tax=Microplitis demolitor TaxID=69319 RepID=UPI0006D4E81E|nr:uncharacterized protein LOC106693699 [Microplitis demolitor]